jgi:hypothetical protein
MDAGSLFPHGSDAGGLDAGRSQPIQNGSAMIRPTANQQTA